MSASSPVNVISPSGKLYSLYVSAKSLSIVTPCHRVIGANGTLTGFAGGLAVKRWLLAHERGEPDLTLA